MKKKILILLALLVAMTLVFVACKDDPQPPVDDTTVADQPTEEPTQGEEDPTEAPDTDPETPVQYQPSSSTNLFDKFIKLMED